MSTRPLQPRPRIIAGAPEHRLLRRVLRVTTEAEHCIARMVLADDGQHYVALVDTGAGIPSTSAPRHTALHILWARDEATAAITVRGHGRLPVAPGDTVAVARGVSWSAGPGLILCEVAGPKRASPTSQDLMGPTHGLEAFHAFNRQTLCAVTPGFSLERWKITQPLTLPGDAIIVNLVAPMALVWSGGTDLMGRGEARIVPPTLQEVTLLPDGLGYALVVRAAPDLAALRRGFSAEAMEEVTL